MPRFNPHPWVANHFSTRLGLGLGAAIALLLVFLLVKLLLPWLLLVVAVMTARHLWKRHREGQQHLYTCFYECLNIYHGRISVLDFAMNAQITGPRARSFLDARAKDFFADFEPTAYGDVLYTFRRTPPSSKPQGALPKLPNP